MIFINSFIFDLFSVEPSGPKREEEPTVYPIEFTASPKRSGSGSCECDLWSLTFAVWNHEFYMCNLSYCDASRDVRKKACIYQLTSIQTARTRRRPRRPWRMHSSSRRTCWEDSSERWTLIFDLWSLENSRHIDPSWGDLGRHLHNGAPQLEWFSHLLLHLLHLWAVWKDRAGTRSEEIQCKSAKKRIIEIPTLSERSELKVQRSHFPHSSEHGDHVEMRAPSPANSEKNKEWPTVRPTVPSLLQ